jgi:DnaA family protein
MKQLPLGVQLRAHARFATYVPAANANAAAHTRGVAEGGVATPVTWLWGAPGTGKTHLLQAACAAGAAAGRRSGYLPLADAGLVPDMLDGWDALDLVCVDDVHRVAGEIAWERALFSVYNALPDHGGTLLVAGDRSPGTLVFALPDLASRLRSGPVFQLAELDDAGRLAALQAHAAARGLQLPDATARYLLRRTRRDMHTLAEMLETLDRASLAAQRRLTIPFVREMLGGPDAV